MSTTGKIKNSTLPSAQRSVASAVREKLAHRKDHPPHKPLDEFIQLVQQSREQWQTPEHPEYGQYELPVVTVRVVLFTILNNRLKVLLIQRRNPPCEHMWSVPGGIIHVGEDLKEAAARRLYEETLADDLYLEQLATFGAPDRDPRARVIAISFYALVSAGKLRLEAHSDAENLGWYDISDLPELAFDHKDMIDMGLERMKERLQHSSIAFQLLPEKFTLTEIQRVYELILGKGLDKRNFRKKILADGLLIETGETKMEGYHRPAKLHVFRDRLETTHGGFDESGLA